MNKRDISQAKDALLPASLAAMERAAQLARQTAIQTNTGIVMVKDGKTVFISAQDLAQAKLQKPNQLSRPAFTSLME